MNILYALCDVEVVLKYNSSIEEFLNLAKKANAQIVQYRDKIGLVDQKIKNIQYLKNNFNGVILVNDDLSLVEYCDGLHIGQDDLAKFSFDKKEAIQKIRDKIQTKILGLSTHNIKEIEEANELDVDYVGLGAYKKTTTKSVNSILGDNLSQIAQYSKKKVAAIGGVMVDDKIANVAFNVVGSGLYRMKK